MPPRQRPRHRFAFFRPVAVTQAHVDDFFARQGEHVAPGDVLQGLVEFNHPNPESNYAIVRVGTGDFGESPAFALEWFFNGNHLYFWGTGGGFGGNDNIIDATANSSFSAFSARSTDTERVYVFATGRV